jgi:hypothetical protein
MAHTPGDWKVANLDEHGLEPVGCLVTLDKSGRAQQHIACFYGWKGTSAEEEEANLLFAHRAAKSHDRLLAALKDTLRELDSAFDDPPDGSEETCECQVCAVSREARDVIKEAS